MSIFDNGGRQTFKYELFNLIDDEYVSVGFISEFVENCSIDVNFSRSVVSSAKFKIRNTALISYLSDVIKPWYVLNDTTEIPLGLYLLQSPTVQHDGIDTTRDIQGYDLSIALEQDTIISSYTFDAGYNVVTAITQIFDSSAYWIKYQIEESSQTLLESISFEIGTSKLEIINSLLKTINYYPLWVNGNGTFMCMPWSEEKNIVHEFLDDELSLYKEELDLNIDYSVLFNRVVCISNKMQENTYMLTSVWTFEDENLSDHPLSYTNIGRYISKVVNVEAVSQEYLDLIARRELRLMLEIEEAVDFKHAFVTSRLDDGIPWNADAYRFRNDILGVDAIYTIASQSYTLSEGMEVTSTIKRIRDVY